MKIKENTHVKQRNMPKHLGNTRILISSTPKLFSPVKVDVDLRVPRISRFSVCFMSFEYVSVLFL
jgi:hypothetical protein